LARCRHCQILFFTHPRNAGRIDLGCPFGCRDAHRRQNAIRRSIEYYQSPEGKVKKKHLNAVRNRQNRLSEPDFEENGGCTVDDETVEHIRLVTSLVEGRWVGLVEVYAMLEGLLRQHSIDTVVKLPYGGLYHQNKPP
jgi:hypothetical protein